ncbi:MAG: hypothetical protein ACE1ZS_10060, partial [Candidatus Poribacteria bacterium]
RSSDLQDTRYAGYKIQVERSKDPDPSGMQGANADCQPVFQPCRINDANFTHVCKICVAT